MRKLITISVLGLLLSWFLFSGYTIIFNQKHYEKCGKIVWKGNTDQVHKYSIETKFVFVVQYPNERKDEWVNASTWSMFKQGDNICFKRTQDIPVILVLGGILGGCCIVMCGILLLLCLANYIFEGDFELPNLLP